MQKILLDTNFLLVPAQFKVDIFSEIERICEEKCELYAPEEVVDELKKLSKPKNKSGAAARLALALIRKKNVNIIKRGGKTNKGNADAKLVELAEKELKGYIVATQDKELKTKLKEKGIKIVTLMQKSYLKMI